jgi:hypothetical protein
MDGNAAAPSGPAWVKTCCPFFWFSGTDPNNKNPIEMAFVF